MPDWLLQTLPIVASLSGFLVFGIGTYREQRRVAADDAPTTAAAAKALVASHVRDTVVCPVCERAERARQRSPGPTWPGPTVACDDCGHPIHEGERYALNAMQEPAHPFDCVPLWNQPPAEAEVPDPATPNAGDLR